MLPQPINASFSKQKLALTTGPSVKLEFRDATDWWAIASEDFVNQQVAGKVSSITGTANEIAVTGPSTDPVVGLAVNPTIQGNVIVNATGYLKIPVGTTAQRPSSPTVGMIRVRTD